MVHATHFNFPEYLWLVQWLEAEWDTSQKGGRLLKDKGNFLYSSHEKDSSYCPCKGIRNKPYKCPAKAIVRENVYRR